MATINRLVTELSADPAPMEAGFARGINITKAFAQSAAQAIATAPRNSLGQFTKFGTDAATNIVTALQQTYQRLQGQLLEGFARGSLSSAQFAELGAEAGRGYNSALLNSISHLDAKTTLPPEVRATLTAALKTTGVEAGAQFANGLTQIGTKLRSLGRDMTQFGIESSLVITAPLVEGARKSIDAAEQISHALDSIAVSTGAVGPRLEGLRTSFTRLFAALPNSAGDIAKAISAISVATGATGPTLEALATQALNLSRITGTDLPASVDATQRAFKAWNITVAEQATNMDTLFKVSQRTGATVVSLADSLGHFAPALQQFGLSFQQSATLIGQFQKNGLDADAILTTLQTSLSKFAEKGIDGAHALQLVIDSLKGAGTDADAINLASRIFGPRQAAQIAEAVRNGSLNIQQLTDTVSASATTINKTAKDTDEFQTSMGLLGHAATTAGGAIGGTLERAFVSVAPLLIRVANGVASMATAFAGLPSFVTNTLTIMLALAAAVGPLVLIFAGLAKATGAVALAFGIVKNLAIANVLSAVGIQSSAAATGMTAAAGASASLVAGLTLLGRVTAIGLVLGAIALAINDLGKEGRDAQKRMDDFNASLEGLSERELVIKTEQLRDDLAARQKQIDDLRSSAAGAAESFAQRFARAASGESTGGETDASAAQRSLAEGAAETQRQLDATNEAFAKAHAAFIKSTQDAKAFQDQINGLITSTGKFVTVDPTGKIHGSLTALKNELAGLQEIASKGIPLPNVSTAVLDRAIEHLQTQIRTVENAKGPNLTSIFDQLSPGVINLDREVSALVAKAQNLGGPLAQLSNVKLSGSILADLANVNRQLEALGDSTSLDAEKLRAMQKALQSTAAAQIGSNVNHAGAFSIDIDGHIKSITVDPGAANDVVASVSKALTVVHDAAEQAAAQQLNLDRVAATGNLRDIELAGIATEVAYRKARDAENAFRETVESSSISIEQQKAAMTAMLAEVARTGAAQDKISVEVGLSSTDLAFIVGDVQQLLAKLPPPSLGVKVFVDELSVSDAVTRAAAELDRAQIQALSGDRVGAQVTRNVAIDALAQQFHDLAKSMDLTNPSEGDLFTFRSISAAAARLGVSLGDLEKRFQDLTTTGKAERLADALSGAATAALGADNAVAKLTAGLDTALRSAFDLRDAIQSLNRGGGFDSVLGALSSIGSIVGAVGAIGGALGQLFGPTALDHEHDEILRSNTAALADLANSIDREAGTAARFSDLARAIAETNTQHFQDLLIANEKSNGFSVTDPTRAAKDALSTVLAEFGLTLAQAEAAAKSLGIALVDSKGNLVASGLKDLGNALEAEAKLLTSLAHDFSTTQKLIAVNNAINNTASSPQQALNDQVAAITQTLGAQSAIAKQLTEAQAQGPEALRAALKALVAQIEAGTLNLADLGGFNNVTDLLDALGTTADDLNALGSAAGGVTDALLNVPAGFKRALTEFNAQLPQAPPTPNLPAPPPPPPTDTTPTRPPDAGGALLDLVKGLTDRLGTAFTAPLTDAVAAPATALDRLSVSASDVADAFDRMFGFTPTTAVGNGESSNGIVGSAPLDRFGARIEAALAQSRTAAPSGNGDVHIHGDVLIDARTKPIDQAFNEFSVFAQRRAHQETGDSTQILTAMQRARR